MRLNANYILIRLLLNDSYFERTLAYILYTQTQTCICLALVNKFVTGNREYSFIIVFFFKHARIR